MVTKLFTNKRIAIVIICVFILGLISIGCAHVGSMKQLGLMDSVNPQINVSITGLGKLIQKGETPAVLQQQLEKLINSNEQFGDLFVINQDAIIIAASDINATGLAYPIRFKSNIFKGLPLPFSYNKSEMPAPNNRYTIMANPELMFKVFGTYKTPDNRTYHIVGTYHVSSALTSQLEWLSSFTRLCMGIYQICFILFWLLIPIWVYQDARRRPTNAAAWGILTLLTSVVGWVVYLIARPLTIKCPACGLEQPDTLKFCNSCGISLKNCCSQCGAELREEWQYCGECGHKIQ